MVRGSVQVDVGRRSAWLSGPWKPIQRAIEVTGSPWMRCPRRKTITVPIQHLDDVISHLEHAQRTPVVLRMAE